MLNRYREEQRDKSILQILQKLKRLEQTFVTGVDTEMQQGVLAEISRELTLIEGLLCARRTLGDPERRNELQFVKQLNLLRLLKFFAVSSFLGYLQVNKATLAQDPCLKNLSSVHAASGKTSYSPCRLPFDHA